MPNVTAKQMAVALNGAKSIVAGIIKAEPESWVSGLSYALLSVQTENERLREVLNKAVADCLFSQKHGDDLGRQNTIAHILRDSRQALNPQESKDDATA